jgi:predicted metal-dependent peptidase
METELLVKKAKLKLFTNSLFFFGIVANKFNWEIEELNPNIEGCVYFNNEDRSKIESGSIYFNSLYLTKPEYTSDNFVYLICHELLHILNKHGLRGVGKNWETWCVACDHVIECFLKTMSNTITPFNNCYNIVPEIARTHANSTTEKVYDWLIQNKKTIHIDIDLDSDQIIVSDNSGKQLFIVNNNLGGITSAEGADEYLNIVDVEQIVAESRAILENLKSRGSLPGGLVTYLDKILKVEIPWEELVERSIKTNIIMKPDDRGWKNLNKMYVPHKIHLPGYMMTEDLEGTGTLIIGVDTSGSISDKNLKKFASVIERSMRYFKTIKVITHDVSIHQRQEFNQDNIHKFYEFISNTGFKGRGGTSHKYLFDEIQKKYWEIDKDDLSMVISLTDAGSDIQNIYKNYNWIQNKLPLVFILTKGTAVSNLDKDFGEITQININ